MIANHSIEIQEQADGTYVYPVLNHKRARGWHLYVFKDGSAQLFTKVAPHGALLGKPIKLSAPTEVVHECEIKRDISCVICTEALKR